MGERPGRRDANAADGGVTGDIDTDFHHQPGFHQRLVHLIQAAPVGTRGCTGAVVPFRPQGVTRKTTVPPGAVACAAI